MNTILKIAAAWLAVVIITTGSGIGLTRAFMGHGVEADNLRLDDQEATVRAIKSAIPGVVSIVVYAPIEVRGQDGQLLTGGESVRQGAATGFLISPDGLILTNRHVASVATPDRAEYHVTLYSGKQYYAQFIGVDPSNDLAILKIFDKNLPYLQIGDSSKLTVGSTVIAIGNALGRYDNSATKGIVSGLGRSLDASDGNGQEESLRNVIQTDAQINVGNSGGPLIDLTGAVVGVSVAKDEGGESLGFAIPINEAKPVITSAKNNGRIIRARLGVRFYTVTPDIAKQKSLSRTTGAYISGDDDSPAIIEGSPAEKAGLQDGDIIFEVDGKPVDERMPLSSYINLYSPGKRLGFKVQRGAKVFSVIVTLDELK